jgi:hypothetical protein
MTGLGHHARVPVGWRELRFLLAMIKTLLRMESRDFTPRYGTRPL